MSDPCIEVNLPTVDNTALECETILSTDCILTADADIFFQSSKGRTLSYWMRKVSDYVKALSISVNENKNRHLVQATAPPVGNTYRDTWYDTTNNVLMMYTNNGTADVWIQISI